MSLCTFPACGRRAVGGGLCSAHYNQRARGIELRPLRGPRGQLGDEPQVRLPGLRVSRQCADALGERPAVMAREVLEEWASSKK